MQMLSVSRSAYGKILLTTAGLLEGPNFKPLQIRSLVTYDQV